MIERGFAGVLASIPSPPLAWATFHIGPLTIHVYALCLVAGMIAAVLITQRRIAARGVPPTLVIDVVLWAIPLGIVGARVYHVLTHTGDFFYPGANLWAVVAIWDGGNALYGSLIGGTVGAIIGCRRAGIRLWSFADALAPAMLAAQGIGRLGNYFNHELFGLPTTLPWGLEIEKSNRAFPASLPAGTLFQPLFLYEMIWDLLGAVILIFIGRRFRLQWGKLFGLYLIWYGAARSYLESIRIDPTTDVLFGIPANVWASFVAIALGIVLFAVQTKRHPEVEPSAWLPGRVPVDEPSPSTPVGSPGA